MRPRVRRIIAAIMLGTTLSVALALGGGLGLRYLYHDVWPWAESAAAADFRDGVGQQRITAVDVSVTVAAEDGALDAEATLTLEPRPGAAALHLVLNPGLRLQEVTVDGEAVGYRRRGRYLRVQVPGDAGLQSHRVRLVYGGVPNDGAFQPVYRGAGEYIVPAYAAWYPTDLQSFTSFRCTVRAPRAWTPVFGGERVADTLEGGLRRVTWDTRRVAAGVPLILGDYERVSRTYGQVTFRVHYPADSAPPGDAPLQTLSEAHAALSALLGGTGFYNFDLVLTELAAPPFYTGHAGAVLPRALQAEDETQFLHLARLVAQDWWGGTVGARWFSPRTEAPAWMAASLPEYTAWELLRAVRGRAVWLRHKEQLAVARPERPLNAYGLEDLAHTAGTAKPTLYAYGPQVANMLAEYVGTELFWSACRRFITMHEHRTASLTAFRHELELLAETDLDEFFRAWFERRAHFDYGISDVAVTGDMAHISFVNAGTRLAPGALQVAVLGDGQVAWHAVRPGALGQSISVPARGEVTQVVLDPEFVTPDSNRADNIWPARAWPRHLGATGNGEVVVVVRDQWDTQPPRVLAWQQAGAWRMHRLDTAPAHWLPSPGGGLLLGLETPARWMPGGRATPLFDRRARLGGATADIVWAWRDGRWLGRTDDARQRRTRQMMPAPATGEAVPQPAGALLAYVAEDSGAVRVFDVETEEEVAAFADTEPAGRIAWAADGKALRMLTRTGELLSWHPADGRVETTLSLPYTPREARFSPDALRVAWRDPAGNVRHAAADGGWAQTVVLEGDALDFRWLDEARLAVLEVAPDPVLPLHFSAAYALVVIDVQRGEQRETPLRLPRPAEAAA